MSRKAPTSTGNNGGRIYAEKMPRQAPKTAPGKRTVPSPKGKA